MRLPHVLAEDTRAKSSSLIQLTKTEALHAPYIYNFIRHVTAIKRLYDLFIYARPIQDASQKQFDFHFVDALYALIQFMGH